MPEHVSIECTLLCNDQKVSTKFAQRGSSLILDRFLEGDGIICVLHIVQQSPEPEDCIGEILTAFFTNDFSSYERNASLSFALLWCPEGWEWVMNRIVVVTVHHTWTIATLHKGVERTSENLAGNRAEAMCCQFGTNYTFITLLTQCYPYNPLTVQH